MRSVAPKFPAVMVLREKGEILFLDRRVCELTGYGAGEHQDLRGLLGSLFPEERDQFQASKLFRLAAATAGRRGSARFQAEFHSKHGRRRRTVVQIQRWGGEPGERSYLVSILPSESKVTPPVAEQTVVMQAVARRVSRLLQGAAACSQALAAEAETTDERFAVLSALIDRAQGLLGSLDAQGQADGLEGTEAEA